MTYKIDAMDRKILSELQQDCSQSLDQIASKVHLSKSPCWNRIKRLQEHGFIRKQVALLDAEKIDLNCVVFVSIKTSQHEAAWLERFAHVVTTMPEVVELYRLSGHVDYLMKVMVKNTKDYDRFYKELISKIDLNDVSSSFSMEQIKYTTELPLYLHDEKKE